MQLANKTRQARKFKLCIGNRPVASEILFAWGSCHDGVGWLGPCKRADRRHQETEKKDIGGGGGGQEEEEILIE